jgi:hypothetical protein
MIILEVCIVIGSIVLFLVADYYVKGCGKV